MPRGLSIISPGKEKRNSLLQEHTHSHSVVIFKDVQTQSVTPSSREVKESGEGKEEDERRGILLKHSGGVFPSPAQPWD
ncbi:hypothetical protein DV515_00004276 [Chloebia gouldiae]|uniref:Uncharacterized protein n=1 Tax=Chloebia gouldiae TaxID=44316 RepID=A0A3L8ST58_CHLGU|nr:hypothetical protein DV515_00004276 [Chloebia gouldiae]